MSQALLLNVRLGSRARVDGAVQVFKVLTANGEFIFRSRAKNSH